MGGGIRNAFLELSGAEWAHFPSYSLKLATASSVTDCHLRNQAKHWKLLPVCIAAEAQTLGKNSPSNRDLHLTCIPGLAGLGGSEKQGCA